MKTLSALYETNHLMLFAFLIYSSKAPVIDGALGNGASISNISEASVTALAVVGPNAAIRVLFCLKSGKLANKECTPEGLKNAIMS